MTTTITICMGSSCFSRGNRINLPLIRSHIESHGIDAQVNLAGCRCAGECTRGPAIRINDRLFVGVDRGMLPELLNQYLGNRKEVKHGSSLSVLHGRDRVPGVPHLSSSLSGHGHGLRRGPGCCHT